MIYEVVYLQKSTDDSRVSNAELEKALLIGYQKALEIFAFEVDQLARGSGKRFLRALLDEREGRMLVEDLSRSETGLAYAARACEAVQRKMNNGRHRELLEQLSEPLRYIDRGVKDILAYIQDDKELQALDHISNINVRDQHTIRARGRTEGTCEWLMTNDKFCRWENSSSSSILWLNGQG